MTGLVFFAVCTAGGLGAVVRYLLDSALTRLFRSPAWPIGIFAVNLIGSCAAGAAAAGLTEHEVPLTVVSTGFLGGFTTFSTLMVSVVQLLSARRTSRAISYLTTTAIFCGAGAWVFYLLPG